MNRMYEFFSGVNTQKKPILEADVRRVNDRIFTGPRGSVQRYNVSSAASDVAKTPYKGSF
jgi:hypothetical protein